MKRLWWLVGLSVLVWVGLAGVMAASAWHIPGFQVARWSNPARPSEVFSWSRQPMIQGGHVIIPAGTSIELQVRPIRPSGSGRISVSTTTKTGKITITPVGATSMATHQVGTTTATSFSWTELQPRGSQFIFRLSVPTGQSDVVISSFDLAP